MNHVLKSVADGEAFAWKLQHARSKWKNVRISIGELGIALDPQVLGPNLATELAALQRPLHDIVCIVDEICSLSAISNVYITVSWPTFERLSALQSVDKLLHTVIMPHEAVKVQPAVAFMGFPLLTMLTWNSVVEFEVDSESLQVQDDALPQLEKLTLVSWTQSFMTMLTSFR